MKNGRLLRFLVSLVAIIVCAIGISWGDVIVEEEATAAYGLELPGIQSITGTLHTCRSAI